MSTELETLARTIDENPDPAHGDLTPAVHALVRHGLAAMPYVLPLLMDADELRRLRAQRALEGITRAWVRERIPPRPLRRRDARVWQQLWDENGAYDWQAPAATRAHAVTCWRAWLAPTRSSG